VGQGGFAGREDTTTSLVAYVGVTIAVGSRA
jgi:hypothetical protein